ncbi:molecular chaperone [Morganella morganii]|nr:molecular chaperone [Morganella morganii]
MLLKHVTSLISLFLLCLAFNSQAGIIIGSTRVIYDGNKKETSVSIQNPDDKPYLIQSWLENDKNTALQEPQIPFILTPPLFRLNGDSSSALRIVKTGNLPDDRESVYWVNIKSIPTSNPNAKNELHISVNSRIKLFYRPGTLSHQASTEAYTHLTFHRNGNTLYAKNPTPFYLSFSELQVNGVTLTQPGMIAPMSEQNWTIPRQAISSGLTVKWSVINDYGGKTGLETQLIR